ncbi:hypothetical protein B4U80_15077, partial [Leptotrombidium deliense]
MRSQMVSIHSKEENNFLTSITNATYYWLGGKRNRYSNVTSKWDDGTPFNFENWRRENFENSPFEFIQFEKGFWIYFMNEKIGQLCQRSA